LRKNPKIFFLKGPHENVWGPCENVSPGTRCGPRRACPSAALAEAIIQLHFSIKHQTIYQQISEAIKFILAGRVRLARTNPSNWHKHSHRWKKNIHV